MRLFFNFTNYFTLIAYSVWDMNRNMYFKTIQGVRKAVACIFLVGWDWVGGLPSRSLWNINSSNFASQGLRAFRELARSSW